MRCPTLIPAVVIASSLLSAGCGSSSSPTATRSPQAELVAYSHCMRTHGVPSFPDPSSNGVILKNEILPLVRSPQFPLAEQACRRFMPNGGLGPQQTVQQTRTRRADALSFAKCMRSHGVSRFPDPSAQGELTVEMVQAQGVDVHAPAVLQAVQTCLPASHGLLTPAKIREALNHAGH